MTKRIYLILYLISFVAYIVYVPFYAYIVNNRVTFQTADLIYINKNQPGGKLSYNSFTLANKNYSLTRSKSILGSVLASKEISQFNVKAINNRSTMNKISYYIDMNGQKPPYTPIGLREGDHKKKDGWYYFTLFSYVNHCSSISIILMLTQGFLSAYCFKQNIKDSNKNKPLFILISISIVFIVLFAFVF